MKLDRTAISFVNHKDNERQTLEQNLAMSPQDRLALVTHLRESIYGSEATTGRLQRIINFIQPA